MPDLHRFLGMHQMIIFIIDWFVNYFFNYLINHLVSNTSENSEKSLQCPGAQGDVIKCLVLYD